MELTPWSDLFKAARSETIQVPFINKVINKEIMKAGKNCGQLFIVSGYTFVYIHAK